MEQEKPHPVDLQEGAFVIPDAAAADVVVEVGAHDVLMQELVAEEEAHLRDLTASDEAVALALHMTELMEMEEPELLGGLPSPQAAPEGPAGAQDPHAYLGDLPRSITFSGAGATQSTAERGTVQRYVPPHERRGIIERYTREATLRQDHAILANPTPAVLPTFPCIGRPRTITTRRMQDLPPDVAASRASGTFPSDIVASAGASSSRPVPEDEVAALPSKTLPASGASSARCTHHAAALARRVAADDVVSATRRTMLADADSLTVFAGMEDGHDNGWYESILRDAQKLEQAEELGFDAYFQQCLPRSETPNDEPYNRTAVAAGEEDRELSLPKFFKTDAKMKQKIEEPGLDGSFQRYLPRSETPNDEPYNSTSVEATGEEDRELSLPKLLKRRGIRPSDLDPDEPDPSKWRPRVPPLDDDDVPKFDCGICMETLPIFDLFHGLLCEHRFCVACMATYVEGRISEGDLPILCPDPACKGEHNGVLHPEECKKAIDFAAFSDWGMRLTERALPPNRRAYCPNRWCGIMLETSGEDKPAMAPCPACNHLLCATCGLEWSADDSGEHDCIKGPEAALVKKLASERRWKQCPKCKMIVERISGCRVMHCRCHCIFCYQCGKPMAPGLEEGGEVCQCNDSLHAFLAHHHH